MLGNLKKNGIKIIAFFFNVLLAAIAVFIIREKDQTRLIEKNQEEKKNIESESTKKDSLPSFENSVSAESQQGTSGVESDSGQTDALIQTLPADNATTAPAAPPLATPIPETTAPAAQNTKPADRKTKTS